MKHPLLVFGVAGAIATGAAIGPGGNVAASGAAAPAADSATPGTQQFYATRVTDIFQDNCVSCHDDSAPGGLRLDSYASIRQGGKDGAILVPGDPEASLLIKVIRRNGELKMPPKRALKDADVADLEAWVKADAVGADPIPVADPSVTTPVTAAQSAASAQPPNAAVASSPKLIAISADADFFENKVRPILANSCYDCHTDSASGGLRLDSKAAFLRGGAHGTLIVPGDPDKSLLIQAVRQTGTLKMPKGGKLHDDEVATLTAWVKQGAPWPATSSAPLSSTTAKTGVITQKQREFWSFQPLKPGPPPTIQDARLAHWARTSIDHYILAELHTNGLAAAPQADRRALIRRVTFDLTRLPPTQQEVDAFVNDKSAKAWEKVVDRLLASPHYGEHWGRHWLDVAR